MFKEDFLHYLWKYKLFTSLNLTTTDKEPIEIISSGIQNFDGGPDFFNSKVKIGDTVWAGNVEIHIRSSDWIKHQHQNDKAYDNVVLHVVYQHDKEINNQTGQLIPTLQLKEIIDKKLVTNYEKLITSKGWIPCEKQIKQVNSVTITNWKERLVVERLERKSTEIIGTLKLNKNDWEETFYQYLFKYFGLKVNALPFQMLASKTTLKVINKHNKLIEIEALLYGQAGFLEDELEDDYFLSLKKEYQFLSSKFSLEPFDRSTWKLLRLRPANFPTIRIAQLAHLLHKNPRLFSKLLEVEKVKDIQDILSVKASTYWDAHYQFGFLSSKKAEKKVGTLLINTLIINAIVPVIFVYSKIKQDEELNDKVFLWLSEIKSENNSIIKNWSQLGLKSSNAMDSQSLIELKNSYCSQKKCLNCSIGNNLLNR